MNMVLGAAQLVAAVYATFLVGNAMIYCAVFGHLPKTGKEWLWL